MGSRIVALALLISSGCSIFLKGVPEDWTPETEPDCQPYIAVPIIDGVLGLGVTAWALGQPCQDGALGCAFALGAGAAIVGAGVYGYFKVRKCERAQAEFRAGPQSPSARSSSTANTALQACRQSPELKCE